MLRWQWKAPQATKLSIAEYDAHSSQGAYHARVMAAFKSGTWATPYSFALDVEAGQYLPKAYTFRVLDEINLIE